MAADLDLLTSSLKQYVVSPLNAFGMGGFVFDVEGETSITLTAEIPDHFLEDNATVQDHISLKPRRITLKRYVGELVYEQDNSVGKQVQRVVQKLTTVSSFLPTLSKAAQQIRNTTLSDISAASALKSASSLSVNQMTDYWSFAKNLTGMGSKQQQAYMYLKALWEARILVSVQTPFEFLNNMAIESVVAIQGENERYVGDFTITLKQMRFAKLSAVPSSSVPENRIQDGTVNLNQSAIPTNIPQAQDRAALQAESIQNNGNVPGTPASIPTTKQEWYDQGLLAPPESR